MDLRIRPVTNVDIEAVVELSLLAWEPVFQSFRQIMGPTIYDFIYPDWRAMQSRDVAKICEPGGKLLVWVAEVEGKVVGFIAYKLDGETKTGEVEYLAVHPEYQNLGIGTELNNFALDKMKSSGMKLAVVGTGGDPGHAPARRSYEKAGFRPLPQVRYYKNL
jgi:ribosomal protein S18 acetylase RimI-like enzyme